MDSKRQKKTAMAVFFCCNKGKLPIAYGIFAVSQEAVRIMDTAVAQHAQPHQAPGWM